MCIEFDKANILKSLTDSKRVVHGPVDYVKVNDAKMYRDKVARWPFIKRIPFQDEDEYRAIYEDPDGIKFFEVSFDLKGINSIHFNPWIQRNVRESTEELIRGIQGCEHIKISQTTLLENRRWIDSFQ